MTSTIHQPIAGTARKATLAPGPRFGGILWRMARFTSPVTMPLAGKRWNPIFAVIEHRGRRSGRHYATPIAARRVAGGFVISLAFGAQVDWYRNLLADGGGTIRWRGDRYLVSRPERIDAASGLAVFHPAQRFLLRLAGVDGYVRLADVEPAAR
jgi:deazaflavin-dependent oxidoreductase (nitroreductase family)